MPWNVPILVRTVSDVPEAESNGLAVAKEPKRSDFQVRYFMVKTKPNPMWVWMQFF